MLACEAAGFDVVIVETVGVGQSEVAVAAMTDVFLVLLPPVGGDELQGIKRGIMELADIVLVNKADGEQRSAANRTVADYRNALHLLRPRSAVWRPAVEACSSLSGEGIAGAWEQVLAHRAAMAGSGEHAARRAAQARDWLWEEISDQLLARLRTDPDVSRELAGLEAGVASGEIAPPVAARRVLARFTASGD
jgi:LAO/AO transport system kinase